ncbi:MAG: hypothetical protein ABJN84_11425 [Flavobacteriaceae bacterium]
MKKYIVILSVSCIFFSLSCEKKDTSFLISENSVGPLLSSTPVSDLEKVFAQDSTVKDISELKGLQSNKIKVFEKGGKHLLTLTPNNDSIPKIGNIRVFDERYLTDHGIGLLSTFKDIQGKYPIKKIVTTLNSIVIFPKESNLYFTIDKEELPANLRYTTSNIEAVQIPENAKLKYLMLAWE